MKKILFLLTTLSLTLTGCFKNDGSAERLEPVRPGLDIYSASANQNTFSMQPAEAGFRLAMLLAEAKGEEDFSKVMYENRNVKNLLFGQETKVEKLEDGDYKITYTPGVQLPGGRFFEGSLLVHLKGTSQLSETTIDTRWTVTPDKFKIQVPGNYGMQIVNVQRATTTLFRNEDDTYTLTVGGSVINVEPTDFASDWLATFVLTPPDESLAYSLCTKKKFKASGTASGRTFYTFNGSTTVALSYALEEGTYEGSSQILSGTERASLAGYGDYDPQFYPARDVKVVWWVEGNKLLWEISYNGATVRP